MQQFLLKLDELRQLMEEASGSNRLLITINSPNGNSKDQLNTAEPGITAKAVTYENGQIIESISINADSLFRTSARAAAADKQVTGCPYPPGCE